MAVDARIDGELMEKELRFIPPQEIRRTWPVILDGVQNVQAHSSDGWIPEDIYAELIAGNRTLHLGYVDGDYIGFLILQRQQGYSCIKLNIWLAYAHTELDPLALFMDDIKQIARSISAREITFASPRRWERRVRPYGFRPIKQVFSMEITP
jgi:hypothetical protein